MIAVNQIVASALFITIVIARVVFIIFLHFHMISKPATDAK